MDAARAREIAEEQESRRDRIGSTGLATIGDMLRRELQGRVTARIVREYVRSEMIEPVVKRMYDIAMGVETFDVPTMAGNTVNVPASASVQVKALLGLLSVGVPTQLGLVDDDGNTLPGVIALGEMDMRSVQDTALPRLGIVARALDGTGTDSAASITAEPPAAVLSPAMAERIERGEFEIVEITEGDGAPRALADQPPPPIDESTMTTEQKILARRRSRRSGNGNGR